MNNDVEQIVRLLIFRFKKSFNVTMNVILHERYIIRDAVNKREFRKYAQKIARSAKNVDFIEI